MSTTTHIFSRWAAFITRIALCHSRENYPNVLPDPSPNPNIHTYLACDSNGGGRSTLDGTVMRTNMMDDGHTAVQWDYALASADSS